MFSLVRQFVSLVEGTSDPAATAPSESNPEGTQPAGSGTSCTYLDRYGSKCSMPDYDQAYKAGVAMTPSGNPYEMNGCRCE